MPMRLALDWRHGLVIVTLRHDPGGGLRLSLRHGLDHLVLQLSESDKDALMGAGLRCSRRGPTPPPWAAGLPTGR